jgi:hypothetical protein
MKKDENWETRKTLSFGWSKLAQAAMLVTCIRELTGLNPGRDINCPDSSVWWFSSVPSDKCLDSASDYVGPFPIVLVRFVTIRCCAV